MHAVTGDESSRVFVASADRLAWGDRSVELPGSTATGPASLATIGPIAAGGGLVVASIMLAGSQDVATRHIEMRGEPGAVLVAFDVATGAPKWRLPLDSTQYSIVTSIAAAPGGGFIVGGNFGGTLRAGEAGGGTSVVSSAGRSDGFVARVDATGAATWLVRVGGTYADSVQGVAIAGDRVAIAGTFTTTAELGGVPLPPFDDRVPFADVFVAELDAATGARKWSTTFGGKDDDSVAGVAIAQSGQVAVAANLRGTMRVGATQLRASGPSDGLVVWISPNGELGKTAVLGGADFDGLRAIAAVGEHAIVGGFFSGTIQLGASKLVAGGGDDSFIASVSPEGSIERAWQVGGPGREEVASIAALPGGFVAGVEHTAELVVDGEHLPAPKDPMAGAALIVRAVP
jgi:outer membrane protein assembly factor BamB